MKTETQRGAYGKRNEGARQRIVESYERGEDWKAALLLTELR